LEEGDRAHAGIPSDARDLLLTEIAPDPRQPRRHFDTVELAALADDIARRGILQPILVRPPAEAGGLYRLVAGERRWRAAQMASRVRIPARVRDMSDEEVRAAQLAENVLRSGLSDIEKGRALRALYELRKGQNHRTTWEDVAGEVGLGRARIHDLFHLADLPDEVAQLIASGRLSGSHGVALQRAQAQLGAERIGQLARRAARPASHSGGAFAMSVARLRAEIQSALSPSIPDGSAASTATENGSAARPFLRRTLEALRDGLLTPRERDMLVRALAEAPPPDTARTERGGL
jgi:ParB family chromosome partitioning protein